MNNSIFPRVTAWHLADLELGDLGAVETTIKHSMDTEARYTLRSGPTNVAPFLVYCMFKVRSQSKFDLIFKYAKFSCISKVHKIETDNDRDLKFGIRII